MPTRMLSRTIATSFQFLCILTVAAAVAARLGKAMKGAVAFRFEEATHRTTRWIDRCIKAHARPTEQNLFGIVQGGLDTDLRRISIQQLSERKLPGYAIGGLAGGEDKSQFCRSVSTLSSPSVSMSVSRFHMQDSEAKGSAVLGRQSPVHCSMS